MKHTKEPWQVFGPMKTGFSSEFYAVGCMETQIAQTGGDCMIQAPNNLEEQKANAERIVVCVNAMEGIEDPAAARVILDEPQTKYARDMLHILKMTRLAIVEKGTDPRFIQELETIIAKAEGKKP